MTMTHDRRARRETPYRLEHDARNTERMLDQASMPKDLGGLLRWYASEFGMEINGDLHGAAVWRDQVTAREAEQGLKPVGASDTGALAYAHEFRRRIESGPSSLDHRDPETARSGRVYFDWPISAAIGRIARGKPFMARTLTAVAFSGFNWRSVAERGAWPIEMFEVYLREALIRLWRERREWTRSG